MRAAMFNSGRTGRVEQRGPNSAPYTAWADLRADVPVKSSPEMSTSRRLTVIALAAVVAAGACTDFRRCGTPQCLEDRRIRDEVLARINARPSLRFFNIDVQTSDREVYLEGIVDTEIDRGAAGDIAMTVPGVRRVHNGLGLNGNANGGM